MWGREGLALLLTICVAEGKLLLLFSPFSEICIEITYVHEGEQIIISSCSLMNFHKEPVLKHCLQPGGLPGAPFWSLPNEDIQYPDFLTTYISLSSKFLNLSEPQFLYLKIKVVISERWKNYIKQ